MDNLIDPKLLQATLCALKDYYTAAHEELERMEAEQADASNPGDLK